MIRVFFYGFVVGCLFLFLCMTLLGFFFLERETSAPDYQPVESDTLSVVS